MPAFSEDQINEAKERVRRMHARAGSYLPREEPPQGHNDRQTAPSPGKEKASPSENEGDDNAVILMLLLLLGREGADQALLLALLYLLF